jgi:type I restriction enzyme S subunit
MGKYQGYERYKHSGVEWLGEIPEHWDISKAKFVSSVFVPQRNKPELNIDHGLSWLTMDDMLRDRVSKTRFKVTEEASVDAGSKTLKKGSIVASCVGNFGICAINDVDVIINQQLQAFIPNSAVVPEYLREIVKISKDYFQMVATAATVVYVNQAGFANMPVPLPPLEEQEAIAQFLDHKTSQIDALISKKEALLEKLDEKRTALISHAVTKGLDPTVPMKDSGIEWLGDIPAHWEVKKLRYVGYCQNGVSKGGDYFGSGYPFVNYTDVYGNPELPKAVNGLAQSTKEDRINYSVKLGDIFFTRTSETIEEIGITSTCLHSIDHAIFSGFLIRVRPFADSLFPKFSKYYFRCQRHRLFFVKEMNLVTRASLSQDLLKRLPVLLPPIEEQKAIAQNLEQRAGKIDQQKAKIKQAIDLLKEYRTALITNAVTGKIDVRQVPIPQP